jgi:hypothetical protein
MAEGRLLLEEILKEIGGDWNGVEYDDNSGIKLNLSGGNLAGKCTKWISRTHNLLN